ncbi:MAG: 1-deoxy-D-xylulose-5-phosphate synthase [Dehalococcoidia bacterium]
MFLENINEPSDLQNLTPDQLTRLAADIRNRILDTVSANGGHLASSLGAVELTIALHRSFNSPVDKILWDVGHQSYAHKLLTGRKDRFSKIRQYGGLSGFPDRSESPHDHFGAGHASTSISAALGMAKARDLAGADYHVVAVIGDGSLTGGMAFEAINHAGQLGCRLIVVLNDNGMAISPSIGALSRQFSRLRFTRRYYQARKEASHIVNRMPMKRQFLQILSTLEKGVKGMIIPSMFWEELGFTYMGPIDGHNINELEAAFTRAKGYDKRPLLIHVVTTKGKGYSPAEDDAVSFHGVSPNGAETAKTPSFSEIFGRTMLRLAKEEPRLVAITAAMTEGTGLNFMSRELPKRVFDVGICEQHAVTFAAGLATQGYIPVVAIYSTFLQRALDQIIHDVCIQNLPVVFAIDRGGIVGEDGKTHQGSFDLSYLSFIPNMVLAAPKDENELRHLLYTAVRARRPFAIRYPRGRGLGVPLDEELREIPIGKWETLRGGNDAAIFATGRSVQYAVTAAEKLAKAGIECTVVNSRFIKPPDYEMISALAGSHKRFITVEENAVSGGFGSTIVSLIKSANPDTVVECIGIPDEFVVHGPQEVLRAKYNLDADGIAQRVVSAFPDLSARTPTKTKR